MTHPTKIVESDFLTATLAPARWLTAAIAGLALLALAISGYLAYTSLTASTVAGCSGGLFDCGHVLHSRWSRWFGIPVSVLACFTYVIMLASLQLSQSGSIESRRVNWKIVITLGFTAGCAALWFMYLQAFVLEHFCIYCLTAHACGLLISILILTNLRIDFRLGGAMGSIAMAGLAVLILGQVIGPAPKTYTIEEYQDQAISIPLEVPVEQISNEQALDIFSAPTEDLNDADIFMAPTDEKLIDETIFNPPTEDTSSKNSLGRMPWLALPAISLTSVLVYEQDDDDQAQSRDQQPTEQAQTTRKVRRLACISNKRIKLDVTQWPLVGNPEATFVFVEMFDYYCPHCRRTHQQAIRGAKTQLKDQLAVISLPLPLNTNCNSAIEKTGNRFGESCEIAKLAVAIWRVDPAKFTEFHNWMFIGDVPPNYAAARRYAEQLVDAQELAKQYNSAIVSAYIQKHVQIYQMTGKGEVPKLMFPTTTVMGELTSPDILVDIIQKQGPVLTQ